MPVDLDHGLGAATGNERDHRTTPVQSRQRASIVGVSSPQAGAVDQQYMAVVRLQRRTVRSGDLSGRDHADHRTVEAPIAEDVAEQAEEPGVGAPEMITGPSRSPNSTTMARRASVIAATGKSGSSLVPPLITRVVACAGRPSDPAGDQSIPERPRPLFVAVPAVPSWLRDRFHVDEPTGGSDDGGGFPESSARTRRRWHARRVHARGPGRDGIDARSQTGRGEGFVLADFFDYIGGTSTGAIIATGLSLGWFWSSHSKAMYLALGRTRFPQAQVHPDASLVEVSGQSLSTTRNWMRAFGDRTFGSLRPAHLVVDRDAQPERPTRPTPLSNNLRATYNTGEVLKTRDQPARGSAVRSALRRARRHRRSFRRSGSISVPRIRRSSTAASRPTTIPPCNSSWPRRFRSTS